MADEKLLSVNDMAARLGIGSEAVRRKLYKIGSTPKPGGIPATRIGKEWRVRQSHFDAFLRGEETQT